MANEYKAFYLKDLLPMIDKVAMECMQLPIAEDREGMSPELIAKMNHDILWNNEGVRDLAWNLKEALQDDT